MQPISIHISKSPQNSHESFRPASTVETYPILQRNCDYDFIGPQVDSIGNPMIKVFCLQSSFAATDDLWHQKPQTSKLAITSVGKIPVRRGHKASMSCFRLNGSKTHGPGGFNRRSKSELYHAVSKSQTPLDLKTTFNQTKKAVNKLYLNQLQQHSVVTLENNSPHLHEMSFAHRRLVQKTINEPLLKESPRLKVQLPIDVQVNKHQLLSQQSASQVNMFRQSFEDDQEEIMFHPTLKSKKLKPPQQRSALIISKLIDHRHYHKCQSKKSVLQLNVNKDVNPETLRPKEPELSQSTITHSHQQTIEDRSSRLDSHQRHQTQLLDPQVNESDSADEQQPIQVGAVMIRKKVETPNRDQQIIVRTDNRQPDREAYSFMQYSQSIHTVVHAGTGTDDLEQQSPCLRQELTQRQEKEAALSFDQDPPTTNLSVNNRQNHQNSMTSLSERQPLQKVVERAIRTSLSNNRNVIVRGQQGTANRIFDVYDGNRLVPNKETDERPIQIQGASITEYVTNYQQLVNNNVKQSKCEFVLSNSMKNEIRHQLGTTDYLSLGGTKSDKLVRSHSSKNNSACSVSNRRRHLSIKLHNEKSGVLKRKSTEYLLEIAEAQMQPKLLMQRDNSADSNKRRVIMSQPSQHSILRVKPQRIEPIPIDTTQTQPITETIQDQSRCSRGLISKISSEFKAATLNKRVNLRQMNVYAQAREALKSSEKRSNSFECAARPEQASQSKLKPLLRQNQVKKGNAGVGRSDYVFKSNGITYFS